MVSANFSWSDPFGEGSPPSRDGNAVWGGLVLGRLSLVLTRVGAKLVSTSDFSTGDERMRPDNRELEAAAILVPLLPLIFPLVTGPVVETPLFMVIPGEPPTDNGVER